MTILIKLFLTTAIVCLCFGSAVAGEYLGVLDSSKVLWLSLHTQLNDTGAISATADSAWLIVGHQSTAADTFGVFKRSAAPAAAEWIATFTFGLSPVAKRYALRIPVGDSLLRIDTAPVPDTAYQGLYTGFVELWTDGQPTQTHFAFEWYRGNTIPNEIGVNWGNVQNPTTAVGLTGTTIATTQTVARADSLGHGGTHAIALHLSDTSGTNVRANITQVGADAIVDNADGRLEVNLEEIADVAVSTATAQLGVNVVSLTDGAIVAADIADNAIDSATFAGDAKKMIAIRADSGIADITSASFAAGAINAAAIDAGAINVSEAPNLDAFVTSRLAPTVAARTLDVSATGEAGIDWGNIGSPTTTVGLTGTTISVTQASPFDYHAVEFRGVVTRGYVSAFVAVALTQANDYWNDNQVLFINGAAAGQAVGVADFVAATDSVDIRPDLSVAPAVGDSFYIVGLLAPAIPTDVAAGTGDQLDSLRVLDTSGVDAPVPNAKVSIYLDGFLGNALIATANAAGWAIFNLGKSTAYDGVTTLPGFTFPQKDFTTGAAATYVDTIKGYNIDVGAPSFPNLCRLNGSVYNSYGTAIRNAIVRVCPDQAGAAKAGTTLVVPQCKEAVTTAAGAFTLDVVMSDSLHYPTADSTFLYNILVSVPDENQPGQRKEVVVKQRVLIPTASAYRIDLYLEGGSQ